MKYYNGNKYEGEWKLNRMHGKGIYFWSDGRRYGKLYRVLSLLEYEHDE